MQLNNRKIILIIPLCIVFLFLLLFIPYQKVVQFTEQRTEKPKEYYVPLKNGDMKIGIRYVHSIHLTDVFETYEVTEDNKIRFLSMNYESLGIGLPGYAAEGETFSSVDGMYAVTYHDQVIDSFVLFIATIDTDLAFRYKGNELNLKKKLEKGKSYKVSIARKSLYQLWKGVDIYE